MKIDLRQIYCCMLKAGGPKEIYGSTAPTGMFVCEIMYEGDKYMRALLGPNKTNENIVR